MRHHEVQISKSKRTDASKRNPHEQKKTPCSRSTCDFMQMGQRTASSSVSSVRAKTHQKDNRTSSSSHKFAPAYELAAFSSSINSSAVSRASSTSRSRMHASSGHHRGSAWRYELDKHPLTFRSQISLKLFLHRCPKVHVPFVSE